MLFRSMLRCPVAEEEILLERDMLADLMTERSGLREQLSMALYEIGFTGKYALEDYLDYLENLGERSNFRHILMDCLYIPAIGLLFSEPALGVMILFVVLVINIMTYFKEKGEVNPYLISFAYILRMIRGAERIRGIFHKNRRNGSLKTEDAGAEEIVTKYQTVLERNSKKERNGYGKGKTAGHPGNGEDGGSAGKRAERGWRVPGWTERAGKRIERRDRKSVV